MVVSGEPNITPTFSRSWLMKIAVVLVWLRAPVILRRAWHIRRAWSPTWLSPISPSISALRHQGGDRVDDDDVDGAGADQRVRDLEGLLAGVGLRDQQLVGVHAERLGVVRVERVLGVDEGGDAAGPLGVGQACSATVVLPLDSGP